MYDFYKAAFLICVAVGFVQGVIDFVRRYWPEGATYDRRRKE